MKLSHLVCISGTSTITVKGFVNVPYISPTTYFRQYFVSGKISRLYQTHLNHYKSSDSFSERLSAVIAELENIKAEGFSQFLHDEIQTAQNTLHQDKNADLTLEQGNDDASLIDTQHKKAVDLTEAIRPDTSNDVPAFDMVKMAEEKVEKVVDAVYDETANLISSSSQKEIHPALIDGADAITNINAAADESSDCAAPSLQNQIDSSHISMIHIDTGKTVPLVISPSDDTTNESNSFANSLDAVEQSFPTVSSMNDAEKNIQNELAGDLKIDADVEESDFNRHFGETNELSPSQSNKNDNAESFDVDSFENSDASDVIKDTGDVMSSSGEVIPMSHDGLDIGMITFPTTAVEDVSDMIDSSKETAQLIEEAAKLAAEKTEFIDSFSKGLEMTNELNSVSPGISFIGDAASSANVQELPQATLGVIESIQQLTTMVVSMLFY